MNEQMNEVPIKYLPVEVNEAMHGTVPCMEPSVFGVGAPRALCPTDREPYAPLTESPMPH